MPRDRLFHPRPDKAHRCVMPAMALDVDAAIAASLRAAENEGWPPIRPSDQRRVRTPAQSSAWLMSEPEADASARSGRN